MQTLLVFAKEPVAGQVKTRLARQIGPRAAAEIYRAFLRDVASHVCKLRDTRVIWVVAGAAEALLPGLDSAQRRRWQWLPQVDGDLGQRLRHAFAHAFAAANDPVAVIGSDCPLLGEETLAQLFTTLRAGTDAVLVPAADGGYAALGLRRWTPTVFDAIPWSSPRVLAVTRQRLRAAGFSQQLMPETFDVDTLADLTRLRAVLAANPELAPHSARALDCLPAMLWKHRDSSPSRPRENAPTLQHKDRGADGSGK